MWEQWWVGVWGLSGDIDHETAKAPHKTLWQQREQERLRKVQRMSWYHPESQVARIPNLGSAISK